MKALRDIDGFLPSQYLGAPLSVDSIIVFGALAEVRKDGPDRVRFDVL